MASPRGPGPLLVALGLLAGSLALARDRLEPPPQMPLISTYIVNTSTHDLHFSSRKAKETFGYTQKISFEEGVRRTVEWYKNL